MKADRLNMWRIMPTTETQQAAQAVASNSDNTESWGCLLQAGLKGTIALNLFRSTVFPTIREGFPTAFDSMAAYLTLELNAGNLDVVATYLKTTVSESYTPSLWNVYLAMLQRKDVSKPALLKASEMCLKEIGTSPQSGFAWKMLISLTDDVEKKRRIYFEMLTTPLFDVDVLRDYLQFERTKGEGNVELSVESKERYSRALEVMDRLKVMSDSIPQYYLSRAESPTYNAT
eukprot:PhF_6_TR25346/c0_g1_i2/m.35070